MSNSDLALLEATVHQVDLVDNTGGETPNVKGAPLAYALRGCLSPLLLQTAVVEEGPTFNLTLQQ